MPCPDHPLPLELLAAQQNRARKFNWYAILPPAVSDLERTVCKQPNSNERPTRQASGLNTVRSHLTSV